MKLVDGKVVMVTGARTGIGMATAKLLAAEGAKVLVGVRKSGDAAETLKAIKEIGGEGQEIAMDVAKADEIEKGVAAAVKVYGKLDGLITNAGIEQPQTLPADQIPLDEMNRVVDINLKGTWLCVRSAIPHLRQPGGAICLVSSLWALQGGAGLSVYSSTKGGVNAMTKALAVELGGAGIRVNCVSPGAILTPMLGRFTGGNPDSFSYKANVPLERAGNPDEVAEAIVWICSDRASYVTGQILGADGGMPVKMSVAE